MDRYIFSSYDDSLLSMSLKHKSKARKRNEKIVLIVLLIFLFAQGWHVLWQNFYIDWKWPSLERQFVSPRPIRAIDVPPLPTRGPTKRLTPTPSTKVTPKPKKVTAITVSNTFAYQSKVAHMDEGQKSVMRRVEEKLGNTYAELIFIESAFHPFSVNSSSGACGLGQFLPCSKMACELTDVDCQLNAIKNYVERRYGSPEKALAFHNVHKWY